MLTIYKKSNYHIKLAKISIKHKTISNLAINEINKDTYHIGCGMVALGGGGGGVDKDD